MDFSKFRESGDLSDITVAVDGSEFKLHKFPLFAKSDFFCSLARSGSSDAHIKLESFPGGQQIFGLVADFCYNMPVDFTKNNVIYIRCAAEYLRMNGLDNLAEVSDKFLHDTVTSAKMSRSTAGIITLLLYCCNVERLAEKTEIVSLCVEALVDCWLKLPTKFSPTFRKPQTDGHTEDLGLKNLYSLPSAWFVNIITLGRDKGVKLSELAEMAVKYVSSVLDRVDGDDMKNKPEQGLAKPSNIQSKSKSEQGLVKPSENQSKNKAEKGLAKQGDIQSKTVDIKDLDSSNTSKSQSLSLPVTTFRDGRREDTGKLLDAVLMALPEEAYTGPFMTTEWLTKVLRVATARGCTCRRFLVKIASEMLNTLSPEELCIISPSVLHDIVVESSGQDGVNAEKAAKLVDTYMTEMARKGVLTSETFKLLASAAPPDCRSNHDKIYDALEYILKSAVIIGECVKFNKWNSGFISQRLPRNTHRRTHQVTASSLSLLLQKSYTDYSNSMEEDQIAISLEDWSTHKIKACPLLSLSHKCITEKDKISSDQRQELLDIVNFKLMTEDALQRACESQLVPPSYVARGALGLCSKLRSELDSVKYIAQMQEEELQKYHGSKVETSPSGNELTIKNHSDSGFSEIPTKISPTSTDAVKAAHEMLSAARTKLATQDISNFRPVHRYAPHTSVYGYQGTVEHDITFEDEMEFKFDRSFRSLDHRTRPRPTLTGSNTASHAATRSYFPYSYRY